MHALKYFRISLQIRRFLKENVWFHRPWSRAMRHSAEPWSSAMSHCAGLFSVEVVPYADPALCGIALDHGSALCRISLDQSAKIWSHAVWLNGAILSKKSLIGQFPYTTPRPNKIKNRGLPNDKFWFSSMLHSAGPKFAIEYLGEFET
jgi:hypothetical protein